MPTRMGRLFQAACLSALMATAVYAGPLSTDSAAILAGSTNFSGNNNPYLILPPGSIRYVQATVDYAVYAPGTFETSALFDPGDDISGGDQYIYAYEVFNTGSTSTDEYITLFSVGLYPHAVSNSATLVGDISDTIELGVAPSGEYFNPPALGNPKTNVKWEFSTNPTITLPIGAHSDILIFASPYAPSSKTSSIAAGAGAGASALLPTPIPEPGTMMLAALGGLGLWVAKSYRRRVALRDRSARIAGTH